MSVVVLVLLIAALVTAVGLLVTMFLKDKPLYGAMGLGLLAGPGALLALAYLPVA
ncbi:hypothetical protein [Saccharothrix yanglingensis]|uniref:hypothetical protein n=1 Tax=Saccharothrix yanglingensis TaxID=659496 RepID=UPI0027D2A184|nr:hypothetical protein [Saccharothrix yanglingensis]